MTRQAGPIDVDTPDTVRLTVADAVEIGERALQRVGYSGEDAHIIVDRLIDNALCGYKFAGLPRILAIAGDEKTAKARTPVNNRARDTAFRIDERRQ